MTSALGGLLPDVTVEIAWGSTRDSDLTVATWTDITTSLEADRGVTITRGKPDADSDPDACIIEFTLDNAGGAFTPGHQPGANWPNVVRGVPIRVKAVWTATSTRGVAFVDEWLPEWPGNGEEFSTVRVTATGRLRAASSAEVLPSRLGCALTRDPVVTGTANLTHFFPMNDEAGSGELLDATKNGRQSVPVVWSLATSSTGTLPVGFEDQPVPNVITKPAVVSLAGHSIAGSGTGSGSGFALWFRTDTGLPTGGSAVQVYIVGVAASTGDVHWFQASSDVATLPNVLSNETPNPSGGAAEYSVTSSAVAYADGLWHFLYVDIVDTGVSISHTLWVDGVNLGSDGATLSAVPAFTSATLGYTYGNITNLANFAVWDAPGVDAAALFVASAGSSYDPVGTRISDLARWGFNLTVSTTGTTDTYVAGQLMLANAPLDLIRTAVRSDDGTLTEGLDGGLLFTTGEAAYHQAAYLTVDCDTSQVESMSPATDDRRVINVAEVTGPTAVTRYENSSSVDYYGTYSTGIEVVTAGSLSVARSSSDTVARHAEWLANTRAEVVEGRPDPGVRFTDITLDLGNSSELLTAWLVGEPLGKRLTVNNPPSQILGPVDVVIDRYVEEWTSTTVRVQLGCSPYLEVWVLQDATLGVLHPRGHTLYANITNSATSLSVVVPTGTPAWRTTGPFPDIDIDGEFMPVSAIAALASGRQTFTVTRAAGGTTGKSHLAGAVVQLRSRHVVAL